MMWIWYRPRTPAHHGVTRHVHAQQLVRSSHHETAVITTQPQLVYVPEHVRFDSALRDYVRCDLHNKSYAYSPNLVGTCGIVTGGFLSLFVDKFPWWAEFMSRRGVRLSTLVVIPVPSNGQIVKKTTRPSSRQFVLDSSDPRHWQWIATQSAAPSVVSGANHHVAIDDSLQIYDPTIEQFDPAQTWVAYMVDE